MAMEIEPARTELLVPGVRDQVVQATRARMQERLADLDAEVHVPEGKGR